MVWLNSNTIKPLDADYRVRDQAVDNDKSKGVVVARGRVGLEQNAINNPYETRRGKLLWRKISIASHDPRGF